MKKAAEKGVVCINYVKAQLFFYKLGEIIGVSVVD